MAKPRLIRTEGIVIRHVDFGEADKLLTLYTPHMGKLSVLAKGVRRPTSRLGGHVELFTHCHLLLAKGRNLSIVTQAETLHSFIGLRHDLDRMGSVFYIAETHDRLTVERVENEAEYVLLLETLLRVDAGQGVRMAVHVYEMQMLGHVGYRPQLSCCVQCNTPLQPAANFFSPIAGGALCAGCGPSQAGARPLSVNALKVLRLMQSGEHGMACRLRLDEELDRELDAIMRGQISYVLEGELRSVGVIRSLERRI